MSKNKTSEILADLKNKLKSQNEKQQSAPKPLQLTEENLKKIPEEKKREILPPKPSPSISSVVKARSLSISKTEKKQESEQSLVVSASSENDNIKNQLQELEKEFEFFCQKMNSNFKVLNAMLLNKK